MAAVTICSDFGAPKSKIWHYFHCFPICFPWSDGTRCHDLRFLNTMIFVFALHIRWPKKWSFSFSISPSNEYSGLISFRIDWFNVLALWRTLKSVLKHHSSKASILWCSAFFMVQLSHLYMTTGKTLALTMRIFVGKVMSLLFNMLSRFDIAFLPRSTCLLISWLQSLSTKSTPIMYWICPPFFPLMTSDFRSL